MSSSVRRQLEEWLSNLDVKADTVIDIGGAQKPVKGRTKSWDVKNYHILDLPEPHADSPKPDYEFDLESDMNDNTTFADSGKTTIFCLEVFDYIVDPLMALDNISWLLNSESIAYVSFPFIYPIHNPVEHEGLRYTENAIRRLADLSQLEVVDLIPRTAESDLLQAFYAAEGMRAAKGVDHSVTGYIVTFRWRE